MKKSLVDITGQNIKDARYARWLVQLYDFLQATYKHGCAFKQRRDGINRSVQFTFKDTIDVDLLVSPYWRDQYEFYEFLKGIPPMERKKCVSLSCSPSIIILLL